jgi:hypothetical protein
MYKKLKKINFFSKIKDLSYRMAFLKYGKYVRFEMKKVIQLYHERILGVFVVLSGAVDVYENQENNYPSN